MADSSDQLPIATIRAQQFECFKTYLERVHTGSKYYAEVFREAGVSPSDIASWEELHKLPTLSTKTLLARNAEFPAVPRSRLRRVIVSGGTSGTPKICFFADNLQEIIASWASAWGTTGLTAEDTVAVLCPLPLASGMLISELLEAIGCSTIPVGLTTPPEVTAKLMQRLGANVIVTQPSTLQRFTKQVRELGYDPKDFRVNRVLLGSEVLTNRTRKLVEKEWGCEVFDTSGSSEVGMIGAECAEHDGHHLAVGTAFFEVRDMDTDAEVLEGFGQLYATTISNLGLPLIRYDMKDLVRVATNPCGCGRTTPRIWFMGRSDDRLVFETGAKFYSYQVDEALETFEQITTNYNIIATRRNDMDTLKLVVETAGSARDDQELKQAIVKAITASSVDFQEVCGAGLVDVTEVELVAAGSLDRTVRGKIQNRFRDLRAPQDGHGLAT